MSNSQGGVNRFYLSDAQLKSEFAKCEFCEEKPCMKKCPADCSAADFIMAARVFAPSDFKRSAAHIMKNNPLGGVCGLVCPDKFCMAACVHRPFDGPVNIPAVQAAIIRKAREQGGIPSFETEKPKKEKIAVVGAGPAGLSCAALLASRGYRVDLYEKEDRLGGMVNLIPGHRLDPKMLQEDLAFALGTGDIRVWLKTEIRDPQDLLGQGYHAVMTASGLNEPIPLGLENEDLTVSGLAYLCCPEKYPIKGKVAVVGGGAVAADCAVTAVKNGAAGVEIIALESAGEMPLTPKEMREILDSGVEISGRTRVTAIIGGKGRLSGVETVKVTLPRGQGFTLGGIRDISGTGQLRSDIDAVIVAIGARSSMTQKKHPALFYAGDLVNGPTTVVEAVAAGKNAALSIDAFLHGEEKPAMDNPVKSVAVLSGYRAAPVSLETEFYGRRLSTPYLLSAAPPSDGFDQMKKAYDAGWSGGVMKTAFDGVPIHIPAAYMHAFSELTYGNCDNVSGHSLDRVCREIDRLVGLYPDRLTMASTGGPVSGNDECDRAAWQSNTRKLERTGVMGIEYSLSCPQGGDGTEGDIVSQNAALTAKIVDWVMSAGRGEVPKLFKLTAAVTSIAVIVKAVKEVLDRYPGKRAGVTLANTFPSLFFRPGTKKGWDEGVVVGMSGDGVAPISNLTLATVSGLGVAVSGNGGPMNYRAAMNFLALGARTVQFCTIVMKHGYGIFDDLVSGSAFLMRERGIASVSDLIGVALPDPITDFMELSPEKKISSCDKDLCLSCGNCSRCPYLAISMDEENHPVTDPAKCIGCSICVQKCFSGALFMRERSVEEKAALRED